LPPYYTDDETLAAEVARHAAAENDPLWRLPLWQRYDQNIDSKVADVNMSQPAAWPARSSARCFSSASCPPPKAGSTSTYTPGRLWPNPAVRKAANARPRGPLYALLKQRYGR